MAVKSKAKRRMTQRANKSGGSAQKAFRKWNKPKAKPRRK